MKRMTQTTRDDFEVWLANMGDALDRLRAELPRVVAQQLDYSAQSLNVLESWILSRYADTGAMLEPEESPMLDALARYVGETFRKAIGGHWDINLSNQKDAYFGLPTLIGFSEKPNPVCSHSLVTASASRRRGDYLSTVLGNMIKRYRSP